MKRNSLEPRTRKYIKGYGFLSFARIFSNKDRKQLLDTQSEALKTASTKSVHKTGEFIGNKFADAVAQLNNNENEKAKPVID